MHFAKLLITISSVVVGSHAVGVKTYSGRDCSGSEEDVTVDGGQGCNADHQRFQSYRENGFGPGNGQRIAFYASSSCSQDSFLYDTYSRNGDYFQSKKCYNINGHSPSQYAHEADIHSPKPIPLNNTTVRPESSVNRMVQAKLFNNIFLRQVLIDALTRYPT
ncbi:hypothetical protein BKA59DRAFT_512610 [Fusarium tricinctum]|uniref:Uncharacterized protein n=1 Tax=Fusarium tricinctum TaxID=61284 RepID=A0A8K0WDN8_9HYPO|nr:hypothetical protein BKA59DRAFT_512610 [Fusarium tricinctum]